MGSLSKPHAVLIPFPAQGHINPFMQLAKLLHSRGYHITFVNNEFNQKRLLRSKGPELMQGLPADFRFDAIPDGLPPSNPDATQDIPSLCDSARNYMLGPFRELLAKINSLSSDQVPKVTCIISDAIMSFALLAAEELGVPGVPFWTNSACGFMAYLHLGELVKRGLVPYKSENFDTDGSLETPVDCIPGIENATRRYMPFATRTTDPNSPFLNCLQYLVPANLQAPAIILNTFDKLERDIVEKFNPIYSHIYTIGPLSLLENQVPKLSPIASFRTNLWEDDSKCLEWLDKRNPNSVIYVNCGSIAKISNKHLKEFAWGLANSKHPFLWIIRPDIVKNMSELLEEQFFEEIKERAVLASWCEQEKVLSHPSTRVFLTHCGWNSIIEGICSGMPMICCYYLAEQPTNCLFACNVWKIGLEMNPDVKREEISFLVKQMMENENGKKMKGKAMEWKQMAEETTKIGGSSYGNFNKFMEDVLCYGK